MGGARGGHLLQKVLWLLGHGPPVWVGMRLALWEVLKGAAGLIGGNDAREVELGDPGVRRPYDLTEVGAVLQGQGSEGLGAVGWALGGMGLAEQVQVLGRYVVLVRLGEILRHSAHGRVHGPVGGLLDAREARHLAVGDGRNVTRPHSFRLSLPHNGGIHGYHSHVIWGGECRSRGLVGQVLLTLPDTHGALGVTVWAHLGALWVPHISWKHKNTSMRFLID